MPIKKKTVSKLNTVHKPKSKTKKKGGVMSSHSRSSSPKQQSVGRKTSPPKISTIAEELRLQILDSVFNLSKTLDNKLITEYFKWMSNVSKINKSFRSSISSITPTWNNISIINLESLRITKTILGVLNMTNEKNIVSIVLRNIYFDSVDTRNKFLEFLSKNTMVRNLIIDKVEVKASDYLTILQTFKRLQWLEISRCELKDDRSSYDFFHNFIKVLVSSKMLEYLTFTNNTIDRRFYNYLFTKDKDNIVYLDRNPYIIYVSKENNNNSWGMTIKRERSSAKNFEVNIVGNVMTDYYIHPNFPNDFAKRINFIRS
jgi:hypothetical protein